MITISVYSKKSGNPVKGARVVIGVSSLGGGVTRPEYTDSSGEAHIDLEPTKGSVIIDGSTKHEGHLSGRVVVYV